MSRVARAYIDVKWKRSEKLWMVRLRSAVSGNVFAYLETRADAIKRGAQEARSLRNNTGQPVELTIFRKDGRIGSGGVSRRTYGADPRRRKG